MLVSIPIITAALAAVVYTWHQANEAANEGIAISREISVYSESQAFINSMEGINATYAFANASIKSAFAGIGNASIVRISNAPCTGLCRVITLSGRSYLMVVEYENSS